MRTRQEIKKQITDAFISNSIIKSIYNLINNKTFEEQFSLVSLENILFDIISYAIFVHEQIVEKNAENSRPQNLPNFIATVLNFHDGLDLVFKNGQFQYDLTNVLDATARKIIARCAVLESNDEEIVVKIAVENNGNLEPATQPQADRILAYLKKMKVPGIPVRLINQSADLLKIDLTVYVNPLIIDTVTGKLLNTSENIFPAKKAGLDYLASLTKFELNGIFVKQHYGIALEQSEGIELVEINSCKWKYAAFPFQEIDKWIVAESGYFKLTEANLTINYLPYDLVNS